MKLLLLLAVSLLGWSIASADELPSWVYEAFDAWSEKYDQRFDSASEREYRIGVFYENLKRIEETNAQQDSYKMGLNQFSAMTPEEFTQSKSGLLFGKGRNSPNDQEVMNEREI